MTNENENPRDRSGRIVDAALQHLGRTWSRAIANEVAAAIAAAIAEAERTSPATSGPALDEGVVVAATTASDLAEVPHVGDRWTEDLIGELDSTLGAIADELADDLDVDGDCVAAIQRIRARSAADSRQAADTLAALRVEIVEALRSGPPRDARAAYLEAHIGTERRLTVTDLDAELAREVRRIAGRHALFELSPGHEALAQIASMVAELYDLNPESITDVRAAVETVIAELIRIRAELDTRRNGLRKAKANLDAIALAFGDVEGVDVVTLATQLAGALDYHGIEIEVARNGDGAPNVALRFAKP